MPDSFQLPIEANSGFSPIRVNTILGSGYRGISARIRKIVSFPLVLNDVGVGSGSRPGRDRGLRTTAIEQPTLRASNPYPGAYGAIPSGGTDFLIALFCVLRGLLL